MRIFWHVFIQSYGRKNPTSMTHDRSMGLTYRYMHFHTCTMEINHSCREIYVNIARIFTYIWLIFMVHVGVYKYTIHGCYGSLQQKGILVGLTLLNLLILLSTLGNIPVCNCYKDMAIRGRVHFSVYVGGIPLLFTTVTTIWVWGTHKRHKKTWTKTLVSCAKICSEPWLVLQRPNKYSQGAPRPVIRRVITPRRGVK